ncbi:MAG: exodeoxyribonuclease VII large subunit [Steroidobacteraceae bacterium]
MSPPTRQPDDPRAAERDVYSVGRLNREARQLLEYGLPALWIEGEISNFTCASSGHWYFSLKDREAQVRCAMFRGRNALLRFTPANGQLVLGRARVSLYEARGEFQLLIEHLEESGVGALRREYERLKASLEAEGLFAPSLKRALPKAPSRIGVVTSPTGAALRDILNILRRRFPAAGVVIYPSAVQGKEAVPQLLAALEQANARAEIDVLIVARGGGSIEDLWAFNDERIARAIRAMPMPVVTGIGHEIDFTIADFAADLRAPTPSGAAELVVPDGASWRSQFARLEARFIASASRALRSDRDYLAGLTRRLALTHPGQRLRQGEQRLDELTQRLASALSLQLGTAQARSHGVAARLARCSPAQAVLQRLSEQRLLERRLRESMQGALLGNRQRLALATRTLQTVSPLATLERGYAIVTRAEDGRLLRRANEVRSGDLIETRLGQGRVRARVTDISEDPG